MPISSRHRAVVLGGGIAGLLAARVLADAYHHVTIVERDLLPANRAPRRGVPQGRHVHGLLPSGLRIMEELLPGLTDELIAAGAWPGDVGANVRWYLGGGKLRQVTAGLPAVAASRALIEGVVRERVRDLENVSIMDGHDIVGLRPTVDLNRITGVRVTGLHDQGSQVLPADLVIDATGRASRMSLWLTGFGYTAPAADRVNIDLAYSSRVFATPATHLGDDLVVVTSRLPGKRRSAIMTRLEGGSVMVTLSGILGDRPPTDLDDFMVYARGLPVPDTYDLIRASRPISDAQQLRVPAYVRHRYERLLRFPAGVLVLGDALCNFNPVHGQGMSVAALNAATLREQLASGAEPSAERFFTAVAPTLDAPWSIAVGSDLAMPGVVGTPLPKSRLTPEYLARLQQAAVHDGELAIAFLRVTSLIDPPTALLRPETVARVNRVLVDTSA
jgi:2-polyprenyl-6-methoxyphenol hydroxylase-like FAD-dependent oxidoreductase